ncbi:MAG: hypothetical protein ACI8TQ_001654 [Planctomycetota bacterium]|jgi:hypothetical protein
MLALEVLGFAAFAFPLAIEPSGLNRPEAAILQSPFSTRLAEADGIDDPVLRASRRAGVFFEARDFGAVLREVESGLLAEPEALELLWRASASEIWLQDGERALNWIGKLKRAVANQDLEPAVLDGWLAVAADFERDANGLMQVETKGEEALMRAQVSVSLIGLVAAIAILGLIRPNRE